MLEAIGAAFVLGAWGWWLISGIALVLLFLAVENDSLIFGILEVLAYFVFLEWIAGAGILVLLMSNPLAVIGWFLAYIGLGTVWSILKWWLYVQNKAKVHKKQVKDGGNICTWQVPSASKKKGKIVNWIILWPISLLWTLLDDFVKKIANKIVETLESIYNRITAFAYRDIDVK